MYICMRNDNLSYVSGFRRSADNSHVSILDTEDLVIEQYTLKEFLKMRKKVNIENAMHNLFAIDSLFDGNLFIDDVTADFSHVVFHNEAIIFLKRVPDALSLKCHDEYVFNTVYPHASDVEFKILWAQELERGVYRVIFRLYSPMRGMLYAMYIGAIFTKDEFLGIEYAFKYEDVKIPISKVCFPKGALGGRLACLNGRVIK